MSSTYGLICLNHDPGIEIGDHTIDYEPEKMLAVAKDPAGRDWAEHAHCDLVVAAYSYPIVRVGCPGKTENGAGCRWHNEPKWIERDLLRLLIAAYQAGEAIPEWAMEPYSSRCWTRERALRLGPVLGLGDAPSVVKEPDTPPEPPVGSSLVAADGTRFLRIRSSTHPSMWAQLNRDLSFLHAYTWAEAWANAGEGAYIVEAGQ